MGERNLDFDTVIDRRNSGSLKYDFAKERGLPGGVIPLWVADMDFRVSSYIQDALIEQVNHGIYGYTETKADYNGVVAAWMKRHHNWDIKGYRIVKTPGVVPAIGAAINAFTEKGDAVLIQKPVYYCFNEVIELSGRRVVSSDLILSGDDDMTAPADTEREGGKRLRYHIDFKDFEQKVVDENIKLFLLCNPHNPGGRVWSRDELAELAEICARHKVVVLSDEIHEDIVYPGFEHNVFATVSPQAEEISVICTSPGKTFNISGLQIGNVIIKNRELYKRFRTSLEGNCGYSQANAAGIAACKAAYTCGEEWYEAVLKYLKANLDHLKEFLRLELPEIGLIEPEATYLVFLDFRKLGLSAEERRKLIVDRAGLWLDSGGIFGPLGEGFERINIACPRSVLNEALVRLKTVLSRHL